MTQQAFKTWWYNEGSQAPYTHHDCEEHTMRMCEIAWNKAQALAQPEQEPVRIMGFDCVCGRRMTVSAEQGVVPAQQRKPLTDEEIGTIAYNVNPLDGIRQFSRAVEAKLKEKNT